MNNKRETEIVEFEGRWYLVWREGPWKGARYMSADLNAVEASEKLKDAYFDEKYEE